MTLAAAIKSGVKRSALHAMKAVGLFAVSRWLTRHHLRILCYHGISLADEHRFVPELSLRPDLFAQRMRWLRESGFIVIGLCEGVEALYHGRPIAHGVVITFDDGWFGTYCHGLPVLRDLKLPATIYMTTYYAQKETAVFNVLIRYLFWKSNFSRIDLAEVDHRLRRTFDLTDPSQREEAMEMLLAFGDRELGAEARQELAMAVARALGLDAEAIRSRRLIALMTMEEVRSAANQGFDIQLHTHRHRFPTNDAAAIEQEISDNRHALKPYVEQEAVHFCYPSGNHDARVWPLLEGLGIRTATTCDPGLNTPTTHPLGLRRILDGENVDRIEFEALLSGIYEVLRAALAFRLSNPAKEPRRSLNTLPANR